MSKLKLDRLINLNVKKNETLTIPKGEFWRGRVYGINSAIMLNVNEQEIIKSDPKLECVEGAIIKVAVSGNSSWVDAEVAIQGTAFKVVENV